MKHKLQDRTLSLLSSLCSFRVVTTEQITRYFYPTPALNPVKATLQVLLRLTAHDFVSRSYLYSGTRPRSVWYVTPKNLRAIRAELERTRRADLFEDLFADAEHDLRTSAKLQQNTLGHEVGISACFLALCDQIENTPLSMPVWMNTSPSHPLLSTKVKTTITSKTTKKTIHKTLPVNPDGFFILDNGNDRTFYFLEYDNNTETLVQKITNKFIAYHAYNKQKVFKNETLAQISHAYGLPARDDARIGVRVLFVTTTPTRRDDLFIKSTAIPAGDLFLFTTVDDFIADSFGAHWLSKSAFSPFFNDYWNMAKPENKKTPKVRPSVLRQFRSDAIAQMEKISIP